MNNPAQVKCLRCGHEWTPRIATRPRRCPNCTSPYWHKPLTTPYARKLEGEANESSIDVR